ncbi:hypothetical protein B0H34DRAFT_661867 [Crassisporium funariophilum]|nr:hypothetical protein B0H34DRAFT_661867 [Crassisporium funariophilum]
MESGQDEVHPTAKTYSLMLDLWHQHRPGSSNMMVCENGKTPAYLLARLVDRDISVMSVVSNPYLNSPATVLDIVHTLSSEAVNLGFHSVIKELGQNQDSASTNDILRDVPGVRPVYRDPKITVSEDGETVKEEPEVPFNLDSLRRHLANVTEARQVLDADVHARQRHLEASVYELAVEQLQHRAQVFEEKGLDNGILSHSELQHWMWKWHVALQARLTVEIGRISKAEPKTLNRATANISPYLTLVKAEKLSLLTILEVMRLQGSGGVVVGMKMTRALIAVGKAVENEYKAEMCRLNNIPIPTYSRSPEMFFSKMGYQHLHQRRMAAAQTMEDGETWTSTWTQAVRSRVGAVLVECLMDVAEIDRTKIDPVTKETMTESQPAFYSGYEYIRGQKLGVLRLNPVVSERMAKDSLSRTIHPRHLPMLVKPKPWLNYDDGGYIYNKSQAMRFKDSSEQELYLKEATNAGTVELVYAGLDVLGSTPWKINKTIFDIVLNVWNSGERMGKIPPAVFDQEEPKLPEHLEHDMEARSHYITRQKQWAQAKANNHSDRCSVNYKIEIARTFLGDTIFLPHNLDFRGRAYPIPPHLSHIGDDLARSLLLFDEAKPLGVRGFRWMKIHLANLYGYDKANFDERVQWVNEHLDEVRDSATKPLEGKRWWANADDPWQCLATCIELNNALELEDPHSYVSALPVHQDGTCNGLQHYAALGGDDQGARQVNLAAADRPSDVYTHVSLDVEKAIAIDAAAGHEMAKLLSGKISRKVVKQTVMTTVYGVTFVGAREQIEKQLNERKDIPKELCWLAASYVAKKVLVTIGDTFKGAKHIQTWFNLCARLIAKSIPEDRLSLTTNSMGETVVTLARNRMKKEQMTTVIWTTPLGLPIVQPYRKSARKQVMTAIQSVYISDPNASAEVNAGKQASAFPPNFIHSLDATHMMLTALECRNRGLAFASVHDSYWTHACDIDKMSEIIRETFIALHSSDILGKLDQEFRERYKDHKIAIDAVGTRAGSLVKALAAAGSPVLEILSQAKQLPGFSDEAGTEVQSAQVVEEKDEDEELLEFLTGESKPTKPESTMDQETRGLIGQFINVTDLIPPLPAKGTFKVETIKGSQYFFS